MERRKLMVNLEELFDEYPSVREENTTINVDDDSTLLDNSLLGTSFYIPNPRRLAAHFDKNAFGVVEENADDFLAKTVDLTTTTVSNTLDNAFTTADTTALNITFSKEDEVANDESKCSTYFSANEEDDDDKLLKNFDLTTTSSSGDLVNTSFIDYTSITTLSMSIDKPEDFNSIIPEFAFVPAEDYIEESQYVTCVSFLSDDNED